MKNQNPCQNKTPISTSWKKICFVITNCKCTYRIQYGYWWKNVLRYCNYFFLYMYEYIYQCVYFDLQCYCIFICWEIKYEKQTHKSLVYVYACKGLDAGFAISVFFSFKSIGTFFAKYVFAIWLQLSLKFFFNRLVEL